MPRINRSFRTTVVSLMASIVALTAAKAQASKPTDTTKTRGLDTMRIVAHYDNGVGTSDAASAGHVTSQLIADRPLLRPGEVMEYVPGMIITQHSGGGKANQYFLRGFNLDHGTDFETTLAGMPVNMPSHAHGQGYMDLNFMIPELVSRIDYDKGPYRAAQGDFATSGSATIEYADRLDHRPSALTVGTDAYGRLLAVGSPEVAGGRVVYGVEADHVDGPWAHPDDYRKLIGVTRYVHPMTRGAWSVTAMGYDGTWNATDQIPERAYASGAIGRFDAVDPSDGGRSHRYSLSADLRTQFGAGQLTSTAYAIDYYLDLYSDFTYFLDDPVHGDQIEQLDDRAIVGWTGSWTGPTEAFGLAMVNTVGWNVRQDHVAPLGLYHTERRVRLSTTLEDELRESSGALYVENETQLTEWLRSIAGLRVERYDFDVASNIVANSGAGHASMGLPKLSLVVGPWRETELFVNAGEGLHSNDMRGATEHVDPETRAAVDPVTPLVRGIGGEVGARTQWIPGLQSSLSLWSLHLASELVFDGDAGTTVPGRPSQRTGVEWSNHYAPNQWLLMDLDLATTRARFTDANPVGNHIPEALNRTASAGITLREPRSWAASLFMRYFGPRALIESDSVRSPSTTLFNSQVTRTIGRGFALQVDVFNILNSKADDITYYYTSRLAGEPAQGVADLHFHPVESRSVRIGLQKPL